MTSEAQMQQSPRVVRSPFVPYLIGVYLPLQIFALLSATIIQQRKGLPWDVPILSAVHATATPQLDIFASLLTQLGYARGITAIVFLIALVLLFRRQWSSLIYLLVTAFGAMLVSYGAKLVFHRARPHLWELFSPLPLDYSFPSGHSLLSMMLLVVLVNLTWGSRWCKWVTIGGVLFVVGIGWTRVYLGVHYPSDVLAGWMLAIAWGVSVKLALDLPLNKFIARKQEYP